MKKIKGLLLFTLCLFIFPSFAQAKCGYQRLAELSKIASNVQVDYSYSLNDDGYPIFSVYVSNVVDGVYVVDNYGNTIVNDNVFTQYPDTHLKYIIYSSDSSCYGEKLLVKYVTLPPFNSYYNHEYCQNNNSSNCILWRDSSSVDFAELYKSYLEKNKTKEEDLNTKNTNKNSFSIILVTIVVLLVVVITIYILKRRK